MFFVVHFGLPITRNRQYCVFVAAGALALSAGGAGISVLLRRPGRGKTSLFFVMPAGFLIE
jgi:hypothetical protein